MTRMRYNHCRFCKKDEVGDAADRLVKYGVRHYAHPACYLDAGKSLYDLHAWQVMRFPYRLILDRRLMADVEAIKQRDDERSQRIADAIRARST